MDSRCYATIAEVPGILAEVLRLKPDIIVAGDSQAAVAAKKTTATTPIVFLNSSDPVQAGLIASFARPGANITGVGNLGRELTEKRVELLKQAAPSVARIGVIWNLTNEVHEGMWKSAFKEIGRRSSVTLFSLGVRSASDIEPAFSRLREQRGKAVLLMPDGLFFSERNLIAKLASQNRLPSVGRRARHAPPHRPLPPRPRQALPAHGQAREGAGIPHHRDDDVVVIGVCYTGALEDGERLVAPVRKFGPPLMDQIRPMAYTELQTTFEAGFPPRNQYYEKVHFLREIRDEAISLLIDHFARVSSPLSSSFFQQTGGAMQRGNTAYAHRNALYNLILVAQWLDPKESQRHVRWTRDLWEALQPYSTGGFYVNDIGREEDDGADRVRAAYGHNYERLAALKKQYDPDNLFRHNQNIKPAA